jgi:hypothetical protein
MDFCGAAVPAAKAGETPAPQVILGQPHRFQLSALLRGQGAEIESPIIQILATGRPLM